MIYNHTEDINMSGGEFDYLQFRIDDCAIDVKQKVVDYDKTCTKQTLARINECAETLEKAGKMLQRVDYFVAGDDGEESFNRRWKEDELDI